LAHSSSSLGNILISIKNKTPPGKDFLMTIFVPLTTGQRDVEGAYKSYRQKSQKVVSSLVGILYSNALAAFTYKRLLGITAMAR
jgi:hypothetical protein